MPIGRIHIVRILLAAAALALVSVYGYYYAREWVAKWAFAHQTYFAADELILIAVPQADLSNRNNYLLAEEEFEWHGQMVDVLHREMRSDTLYIYGFRDAAETELKRVAAWLYQDTPQPGQWPDAGAKRVKWSKTFIIPAPAAALSLAEASSVVCPPLFFYFHPYIRLPLLDVPFSPPDLA